MTGNLKFLPALSGNEMNIVSCSGRDQFGFELRTKAGKSKAKDVVSGKVRLITDSGK